MSVLLLQMSFNILTDPQADLKIFGELKQVIDPQAPDTSKTLLDIVMDYTGDYGTTEAANPICAFCGPVAYWPCHGYPQECADEEAARTWEPGP